MRFELLKKEENITYCFIVTLSVSPGVTASHTQVREERGVKARVKTRHRGRFIALTEKSRYPRDTEPQGTETFRRITNTVS